MALKHVLADVVLIVGSKVVKVKAIVDTGASRSVMSKRLAEELGCFVPHEKPCYIGTADKEGRLRIIGYCHVYVVFQGVEVPGGAVFEVAENIREDIDLVIGRPEIDSWDIIFTSEEPRPRKIPIEFEII